MEFPTLINWTGPVLFKGCLVVFFIFILQANSGDPDQTPRSAVSDLGLHRLHLTGMEKVLASSVCLSVIIASICPYVWNQNQNHKKVKRL